MDQEVAIQLIDAEIAKLRMRPYRELAKLVGSTETREIAGEDRKTYQLEIQFFWDGPKHGPIRVMVSADDVGLRAFHPLTRDFIMALDGTFIGE